MPIFNPKSKDIVLEPSPPSGRKPPAPVRSAPRIGHEANIGLGYFWCCVCGSEIYSETPITSCPACHRKP